MEKDKKINVTFTESLIDKLNFPFKYILEICTLKLISEQRQGRRE